MVITVSFVILANAAPDWTWSQLVAGRGLWQILTRKTVLASYERSGDDQAERYATRNGNTITIYPTQSSFRVPDSWIAHYGKYRDNFHFSREELAEVQNGAGEWDEEYGRVANALFPYDECAAHAGGEGWGRNGSSFGDVQLRVYITKMSPEQVIQRMAGRGLDLARRIQSNKDTAQVVDLGADGRFRHADLTYRLFYGDYGGTARIREYAVPAGDYTLVLFFMGGEEEEVQSILKSVALPAKTR